MLTGFVVNVGEALIIAVVVKLLCFSNVDARCNVPLGLAAGMVRKGQFEHCSLV